jgi:hypothetical protein
MLHIRIVLTQKTTDIAHIQDGKVKLVFSLVTLGSFGMAAVMSFLRPELVLPWIGLAGTFGAYLSGIPSKIHAIMKA